MSWRWFLIPFLFSGCVGTGTVVERKPVTIPNYAPVRQEIQKASSSVANAEKFAAQARDAVRQALGQSAAIQKSSAPDTQAAFSSLNVTLTQAGQIIDNLRTELGTTQTALHTATTTIDVKNGELLRLETDYKSVLVERNKFAKEADYWHKKQIKAVEKLNWYRLRFWGIPLVIISSLFVIWLLRGTVFVSKILGRVGLHTATGITLPTTRSPP